MIDVKISATYSATMYYRTCSVESDFAVARAQFVNHVHAEARAAGAHVRSKQWANRVTLTIQGPERWIVEHVIERVRAYAVEHGHTLVESHHVDAGAAD
ncbi:hypothetical protein H1O16_gp033 [Burkholderia phage BcepSaruman]|uniref:Uncharacterized protein n=1 Tax=Burkholderia phage BcepSaruman TaxID=2530032 RepID=A0A4D5ZD37_9CAUD|nr:hypothetical protein H1O16_gp033 [Burkholderia phage BcepSaruman]QBX06446.1 hypothetical protein BcepSaruman_033 [Burkholderia phage BcepSaruman]